MTDPNNETKSQYVYRFALDEAPLPSFWGCFHIEMWKGLGWEAENQAIFANTNQALQNP